MPKKFVTAKEIGDEKDKIEKEFAARLEKFTAECDGILLYRLYTESKTGRFPNTPYVVKLEIFID